MRIPTLKYDPVAHGRYPHVLNGLTSLQHPYKFSNRRSKRSKTIIGLVEALLHAILDSMHHVTFSLLWCSFGLSHRLSRRGNSTTRQPEVSTVVNFCQYVSHMCSCIMCVFHLLSITWSHMGDTSTCSMVCCCYENPTRVPICDPIMLRLLWGL